MVNLLLPLPILCSVSNWQPVFYLLNILLELSLLASPFMETLRIVWIRFLSRNMPLMCCLCSNVLYQPVFHKIPAALISLLSPQIFNLSQYTTLFKAIEALFFCKLVCIVKDEESIVEATFDWLK